MRGGWTRRHRNRTSLPYAFYNVNHDLRRFLEGAIATEEAVFVDNSKRSGTQSLGRAMVLLRELAARGQFGWGLGDLAARCGLDKGTAHRLLAHLKRERMVQQRAGDRRYVAGPMLYELGLARRDYTAFQQAARAPLERLVTRLGEVAFLFLRSGNDFVCAACAGTLPVKSLSIEVGTRRPLVSSAGGVAILVAMPTEEARTVIAQNLAAMSRFGGLSIASLERMLRQSQRQDLGVNEQNVMPGWNAYALAVRDASGAPFASLMVAAPAHRLSLADHPHLMDVLAAETKVLGSEAARLLPVGV